MISDPALRDAFSDFLEASDLIGELLEGEGEVGNNLADRLELVDPSERQEIVIAALPAFYLIALGLKGAVNRYLTALAAVAQAAADIQAKEAEEQ